MVAMRWLMRVIGLCHTVIIARILSPDDYGVMAMSAVMVELLMTLSDTNVDLALMREPGSPKHIYDSAWTVQLLFGLFACLVVVASAPMLASYYHDPRVTDVMYVLALRPLILGFENVGVVEFRKTLDFAKEFRYAIFRRLSLFVFSIILAFTLRSYFALAIAAPVSAAVAVAFSYGMSKYRPRLCFSHIGTVWSASKWMILQNASQSALDRSDEFVIGGVASSSAVGNYFVAGQVAPMPTREVAWPLERTLMPVYARIADDEDALRTAVINVMGLMGTICIALGVGVMLVAHDLVVTVFGQNWTGAIPFFRWLAIFGIFAALGRPLMPLFFMRRREKSYAILALVQVIVTLALVITAAHHFELVAVAAARTLAAAGFFIVLCVVSTRIAPVRMSDFARVLWRPALAAGVMVIAVRAIQGADVPPMLGLLRDCVVGAAVFGAVQITLWGVAGRPQGPERILLDQAKALIGKIAAPRTARI
jgi:lipopolysaccharide exporter